MRLFEAITHANQRAAAGDSTAGLRPADYADELPIVALTCIDPRLNPLMPEVLGVPEEQFIWLRNAGNIITSPLSSTMRSLALACAIKGGKEIAIIGHTDCQVGKATAFAVLERLREMGVNRNLLPDNLNEFFGMFSSERANVIKAAGLVRSSPLIGSKVRVHGLLVDVNTGALEWIVNGYETVGQNLARLEDQLARPLGDAAGDLLEGLKNFNLGDLKLPDVQIGNIAEKIGETLEGIREERRETVQQPSVKPTGVPPVVAPPPKLPMPRPTRPKLFFKQRPPR